MKANLKIKKFGPIESLDIEIRKFNILIGPQASGKSTISKVLCIIHMFDYRMFTTNNKLTLESVKQLLAYYRIENFYNNQTYWYFQDSVLKFKLENGIPSIEYLDNGIQPLPIDSYYFPAERIALPMISESLFELNLTESSLPKYFLKFGRDFMIAKKNQKTFNLPLLDVHFEYIDGKNIVILRNAKTFLLEETSSAIQSNLPLLVILEYPVNPASLFVIEELELHNFPQLQKNLLYHLVQRMQHPKLKPAYVMLPTHSPYLLSAANNLLFASKVGNQNSPDTEKIINKKSWIKPEDFTAYYIKDGKAASIVDVETGLIHENMLDSISDDLAMEFDRLMNLYNPAKA